MQSRQVVDAVVVFCVLCIVYCVLCIAREVWKRTIVEVEAQDQGT